MTCKKVLWYDPRVNSPENKQYFEAYLGDFQNQAFTEVQGAVSFLNKASDAWIVITSGTNGEQFVSQIAGLKSVIRIIIFCSDLQYHSTWSKSFPKVSKVINSGFEEVAEEVREIEQKFLAYLAFEALDGTNGAVEIVRNQFNPNKESENRARAPASTRPAQYYHHEDYLSHDFKIVAKLCLKHVNIAKDQVLNEIIALNPNYEEQIRSIFNQHAPDDLLKTIIYLYSTEHVYWYFNQCYANREYAKIMHTTAACLKELKTRSELLLSSKTVLYRGVKVSGLENQYRPFESGFWSSFSSCSKNKQTAIDFAEGHTVFEIHLSGQDPHPHIVLGSGWSNYPNEQEVLLYPCFALRVLRCEKKEGVNWITLEQRENEFALTLNDRGFMIYWEDILVNYVKPTIHEFFGKVYFFDTTNSLFDPTDVWNAIYDVCKEEIKNLKAGGVMRQDFCEYAMNMITKALLNIPKSYAKEELEKLKERVKVGLVDYWGNEIVSFIDLNTDFVKEVKKGLEVMLGEVSYDPVKPKEDDELIMMAFNMCLDLDGDDEKMKNERDGPILKVLEGNHTRNELLLYNISENIKKGVKKYVFKLKDDMFRATQKTFESGDW